MRKNRPLSSTVDSAGEVAEGEIMTMPLGTATLVSIAVVAPEHMAPTMPSTPSEVIRRSATATAAEASMQVESPRTEVTALPPKSRPLAVTSAIAISAPAAIGGASDSSGPVKPSETPSVTGPCASAWATPASASVAAEARSIFFICQSPRLDSVIVMVRNPSFVTLT